MVAQDVEKLKSAFGDQAFSGVDAARVLGIDSRGTGGIFKYMIHRRIARRIKSGSYQFINQEAPVMPEESQPTAADPTAPVVTTELPCSPPSLVRIGELYLHERLLLIADTARQEGSDAVRLYTTIIEVDPASKHPRNKIINFVKARDPREYAQARAWLDSLAGLPPMAIDETALELAAELEKQLNASKKEIADLKAKIETIRGMIGGSL